MGEVVYLHPPDPDEDLDEDLEPEQKVSGFWFWLGVLLGLWWF